MDLLSDIYKVIETDNRERLCSRLADYLTLSDEYGTIINDYFFTHNRMVMRKVYNAAHRKIIKPQEGFNLVKITHNAVILANTFVKLFTDLGENTTCMICLEDFKFLSTITKTSCGHMYHYNCLKPWIDRSVNNFTCPYCRKVLCE